MSKILSFFQNSFQANATFKLLLRGSCRSSLLQLGDSFVVLQIYPLKVKLETSWRDTATDCSMEVVLWKKTCKRRVERPEISSLEID